MGEKKQNKRTTTQNSAKWILKIKNLTAVFGKWAGFCDLAVQFLGWWVTATTPVTGENLNPFRWVLRELLQVNAASLERQFPESSGATIHIIIISCLCNSEFTLQMKHGFKSEEGGFELISAEEGCEHSESGFPKMGPTVPPRQIQVSRNTRLGSYNMWRPAKPVMSFKKSITSRWAKGRLLRDPLPPEEWNSDLSCLVEKCWKTQREGSQCGSEAAAVRDRLYCASACMHLQKRKRLCSDRLL